MSRGRRCARVLLLLSCVAEVACTPRLRAPVLSPPAPSREALLVLPGFGYGRAGADALRGLAPRIAAEGLDLYVPRYISRGGLAESRARLLAYVREQRLERYERLHVFAFIAGAWTLNPLAETGALPNLATVVYDRSPLQERAPRIADEKLHVLTWVRYGSPVFDLARAPYPALTADTVRVGLMVETVPTGFVLRYRSAARSYGPVRFECEAFGQRHDDCMYLALDHSALYRRFATAWPDLIAFIRSGRFTNGANRTAPTADPLADVPGVR